MVTDDYNLITREAEAGIVQVQGQPVQTVWEIMPQKNESLFYTLSLAWNWGHPTGRAMPPLASLPL
jgi:hypothetical protein